MKHPKQKPIRKVYIDLLVMVIGFGILGYFFRFPYLYIVCGLVTLSASHHLSARWVSQAWEKFGKFLGKINSTILLSIFYVLFITPFGYLYRAFRKDGPSQTGNWTEADSRPVDFTKPW